MVAGQKLVAISTNRKIQTSLPAKIIVIVGPTASGKSDLAIKLAKKFNGEIISADSRQVYRGMDIGTGKVPRDKKIPRAYMPSKSTPPFNLFLNDPTASPTDFSDSMLRGIKSDFSGTAAQNTFFSGGIRHWLLDVADPKQQFTVSDFQRLGRAVIADIISRGKIPIICGGTGFYVDSLVNNTALPQVPPNTKLRAQLEKKSISQLYAQLKKLDPRRAKTIDGKNKRRLVRALEIVLATDHPVPARRNGSPYEPLYMGISLPMEKLKQRIKKRVNAHLKRGMVAEVRRLYASDVSWKRLESFGLAYKIIPQYLHRKISLQEARNQLVRAEQHYAKRQMTWFKRNKSIAWVSNKNQAMRLTKKFLC